VIRGHQKRHRNFHHVDGRYRWQFDLTITAYNPIRLPRLLAPVPA
jgi:hypothetical protein